MNRLFVYIKSYFVNYLLRCLYITSISNQLYMLTYEIGSTGVIKCKIFESYEEAFKFCFEYEYSCGEYIKKQTP